MREGIRPKSEGRAAGQDAREQSPLEKNRKYKKQTMQFRIFTISAFASEAEQEELNHFVQNHRVVEVAKQYDAPRGVWTFLVTYVGGEPKTLYQPPRTEKVDYKALLTEEEFARFAKLREARKLIAKDESVPAFAIFTDKELAEMAKLEDLNEVAIKQIEGINSARVEHHAARIITMCTDEAKG